MPIGTAERPINIKDLILDTPERAREFPFDPEKEITEEDWELIRLWFDEVCRNSNRISLINAVNSIKTLDPVYQFNFDNTKEKDWNDLLGYMHGTGEWSNFSRSARSVKLFDPSFKLDPHDVAWAGTRRQLDESLRNNDWDNVARYASDLKILDPSIDLGFDQEVWQGIRVYFDTLRHRGYWTEFAGSARNIKIIDPSYDFGLDNATWKMMHETLDIFRRENRGGAFADLAVCMKILAADEVKVTDKGLEINMRKPRTDFAPPTPPMPEVRRF